MSPIGPLHFFTRTFLRFHAIENLNVDFGGKMTNARNNFYDNSVTHFTHFYVIVRKEKKNLSQLITNTNHRPAIAIFQSRE